ncbi:MAG: twin-arginine translocase subunit TatB [Alphaproteobacteria bacterium]|nr:twin-arginine translocase subunit TatB [Alphaproteobacteria bacterium]
MFPEGRLFDIVILGVIALIVVGPKDLPILMRKVGQALGRMRAMAAEFRASFDELARQSELDELRKEVDALRAGQIAQSAMGLTPELKRDLAAPELMGDIHGALTGAATAEGAETALETREELDRKIAASIAANAEAERAAAPGPGEGEPSGPAEAAPQAKSPKPRARRAKAPASGTAPAP